VVQQTFFIVEVAEEGDKLLLVLNQDIKDGFGLVRVGHEHFEDVESLKLNSFVLVPQEVHHQFEVLLIADVLGHDVEIGSVQQQLAKKLAKQSTPFRGVHPWRRTGRVRS